MYASFQATFYNIGQGLFYTFQIFPQGGDNTPVNIIYDCGTESKKEFLDEAIVDFAQNTNKKLHILIISHFHKDHISGLNNLLNAFEEKEIAIIPYYHPLERLIFYVLNPRMPRWFKDFLKNPVKFLKDKGFQEVFVINNGEPPEPFNPGDFNIPPDEPLGGDNIYPLEGKLKFFDGLKPLNKESQLKRYKEIFKGIKEDIFNSFLNLFKEDYEALQNFAKLKLHVGFQSINFLCENKNYSLPIWLFNYYNYNRFNGLKYLLENTDFKKLLSQVKNDIWQILEDTNLRRKLKEIYKKLARKLILEEFNNTSLVALHTPFNYSKTFIFLAKNNCFSLSFPLNNLACGENAAGFFLTGDINFNYKEFDKLITHFNPLNGKIKVSLIPHHGSRYNWSSEVLNIFNKTLYWVVSSGCKNKYNHPHLEVIYEIAYANRFALWCNECFKIQFKGGVLWNKHRLNQCKPKLKRRFIYYR